MFDWHPTISSLETLTCRVVAKVAMFMMAKITRIGVLAFWDYRPSVHLDAVEIRNGLQVQHLAAFEMEWAEHRTVKARGVRKKGTVY